MGQALNNRIQKKYSSSRREKYLTHEKEKLKPLPEIPYCNGEWRKHKPHADCHIQYFYSVPYKYRGQEVDVRISGRVLEVYKSLKRIAVHTLLSPISRGRYMTDKSHLPDNHKAIYEQTPQTIIEQSTFVGSHTHGVINRLINESRHPLMYLRRCQGILRLKSRYSAKCLEAACVFFKEVSLVDIRVSNIEIVILANASRVPASRTVKRNQNENLRGQSQWSDHHH